MKPWSPPLKAMPCGEEALGWGALGIVVCSSFDGGAPGLGFLFGSVMR